MGLRQQLDAIEPHFKPGGRFENWYALYEAVDTIFYSPGSVTKANAHVRDGIDLKRIMITVWLATFPAMFYGMYNIGLQANDVLAAYGGALEGWRGGIVAALGGHDASNVWHNMLYGLVHFLPLYLVTFIVGGFWEVLFAMRRGHEVNEGFFVTSILFTLTLPPDLPLWQAAMGISFGVVIGKEVFGGTGRNFLNPALTARAFLYFAFPAQSSGDKVWNAFGNVDGISGATVLGNVAALPNKAEAAKYLQNFDYANYGFGFCMGSMGETSTFFCALGAFVLVLTGIGSWRIMLSVLLAGLATASVGYFFSGDSNAAMFAMNPIQHLVVGSFAFGLVFMATDPVSASMTDTGKYIYGGLIGFLVIMIRVINPAYPEGMMLAILVGNVFAPLIDYFVTQSNINRRLQRWSQNAQVEA